MYGIYGSRSISSKVEILMCYTKHLEKVDATLIGEIPTVRGQVALHLNNVAHLYNKDKESHDSSSHGSCTTEIPLLKLFFSLEAERKKALAKYEAINKKMEELSAVITRLKKEIDVIRPESNSLATKINSFFDEKAHLYTQYSSLDHNVGFLQSQKIGLERYLAKGQDALAEANKTWDQLYRLLEYANQLVAMKTVDSTKKQPQRQLVWIGLFIFI